MTVARARDKRRSAVILGGDERPVRFSQPTGPEAIAIELSEPREVRLRAELAAPGVVILGDAYFPGWKAWVNGEPAVIYRADYLFRGVALDPGSYEIVFRYLPQSVRIGSTISLLSVLACVGLVVAGRRSDES